MVDMTPEYEADLLMEVLNIDGFEFRKVRPGVLEFEDHAMGQSRTFRVTVSEHPNETVLKTVGDLEELEVGTVVLTWTGDAAQLRTPLTWRVVGDVRGYTDSEMIDIFGPLVLRYKPVHYDMAEA